MKHFAMFLAIPVALFLSCGSAFAQHSHGTGGAMMGVDAHGDSGVHGNATGSEGAVSHGAASTMASTNPGDVLGHNMHLAAKLEGLLGLTGQPNALTTLKNDAMGFKNFGQFMAAVHVSHNLGIPFADLQVKMSGPNRVSLGKAIQELRPDADAKAETKKATTEANEDLNETS